MTSVACSEVVNTGWLVSVCSPEVSSFGSGSITSGIAKYNYVGPLLWGLCMCLKIHIFERRAVLYKC